MINNQNVKIFNYNLALSIRSEYALLQPYLCLTYLINLIVKIIKKTVTQWYYLSKFLINSLIKIILLIS